MRPLKKCVHGNELDKLGDLSRVKLGHNAIKEIREGLLMSRAELARKAGVSVSTIYNVEKGKNCQPETKRKLILALGYHLSETDKVFPVSVDN